MPTVRRRRLAAAALAPALLIAVAAGGSGRAAGPETTAGPAAPAASASSGRCVRIDSAAGPARLAPADGGYRGSGKRASGFFLKATGLATYMLQDRGHGLLAVDGPSVSRTKTPGPQAEWALRRLPGGDYLLASTAAHRLLAVKGGPAYLVDHETARSRFRLPGAHRCARFPEAHVGARGNPFRGTLPDGTVAGYADLHLHITANMRAGGRVIHGESFDRFGISEALGHDADDHGPDGSLDVTGNLLRTGEATGTHDVHGWPTFAGWPVHDTITHQQTYYVWLQRAWMAGLRLVVAQTVEDQPICDIEPVKSHSCDETQTIRLEIAELKALQRYVDAQSGGRGRGWFRIVTDPRQARRVIERGKLAVVIGVESSDPLGCSERLGMAQCTREQIDRNLDDLYRRGVRSLFIAHWVDNALAGPAFEGGDKGQFISLLQLTQTGQPFATEPCGAADEDNGQCNARGLTNLGAHLVRRMMAKHMLIEVDHLSQKAREAVMEIAEARHYPLVSSHTGTGGEWIPSQLRRLYALGGIASATPDTSPGLARRILSLHEDSGVKAGTVALGTDTGGFSSLPGPRSDAGAHPLRYPFRMGGVRFTRQRTGSRVYDLNRDGVAHYGLFPDLLADMRAQAGGRAATRVLFRSAEGYLRMWARAAKR
jgi:microsomal dipeptidase-like Zn-dependent dipeptidase